MLQCSNHSQLSLLLPWELCSFGDTLHLGSLIGATIISIGFYTVMWGKAKEEVVEDVSGHETQTTQNVPLLQSYETDRVQKKMDANV
uniref:WAT1-related protein n=1 Tax=Medicago truncatula TaxID=3880 RepID=I3T871_MEDTR|nr:unknown [Medicago truncatula]